LTNNYVNSLYELPETKKHIKLALISDLHTDFGYVPGNSNNCGKPLCCRVDSGPPKDSTEVAGKWGDYACDIPPWTLENMLSYVNENIDPDAVLWLGDSIPHNVDSLTIESNIQTMFNVTEYVKTGLADQKVYPTVGNHDTYPQDIISLQRPRANEAFNKWAPDWESYMPNDVEYQRFLDYGYYSADLVGVDGKPLGNIPARMFSLNTNICY
jgi:sphingomyelin phosphodiesterase